MFDKLFGALYLKVFVNIIVGRTTITVYVEYCSGDEVTESFEKTFETLNLTKAVEEYISLHTAESPYFYISMLDKSQFQGALPSCNAKEHAKFIDISSYQAACYKNAWTYYTLKSDLLLVQKEYARVGLDFIFSPFVILAEFFKEKIDVHTAMFVLVEDSFLSLSVFENGELLFAEHLDMFYKEEAAELLIEDAMEDIGINIDLENSIDLEDIDADEELGDLEDFGDIEDLDEIDEIDEFSDEKELDSLMTQKEEKHPSYSVSSEGFSEDYQRFSLIQTSVKHFYKNPKYKSVFIENVYIADAVGLGGDLKHYLEDEMFLNVHIRKMDLLHEMCSMAKKELG
ncbi:MAG: hypothetical protein PHI89_07285 [Thiovulaceae bacterium]|nr:hypothetical protein [Sulfurimonadaceae bacterium]MDD3817872.1 hypothetical protein [Sulfurimonadaceae bacterium]